MDIWTAIKNRRSIRNFIADPVEEKELRDLILKTGIWSPSGGNAQTWRFIVITDQKILNKLKLVSPGLLVRDSPSDHCYLPGFGLCFKKRRKIGGQNLIFDGYCHGSTEYYACSKVDPEMIEVSPRHIVRCHLFAKLENKK